MPLREAIWRGVLGGNHRCLCAAWRVNENTNVSKIGPRVNESVLLVLQQIHRHDPVIHLPIHQGTISSTLGVESNVPSNTHSEGDKEKG